jgi:flagellar hook protein FlgE
LTNFSVGDDGVITGTFSNGMTRSLGQVAIAKFTNQEGLIATVNNLFITGPNSGEPVIVEAQQFGAGREALAPAGFIGFGQEGTGRLYLWTVSAFLH